MPRGAQSASPRKVRPEQVPQDTQELEERTERWREQYWEGVYQLTCLGAAPTRAYAHLCSPA